MAKTMAAKDTPQNALQSAELEQIQLQNEKLRLELAQLQRRKSWYGSLIQVVPIITTLVAIAGFLWGVIQYRDQQIKNRIAQEQQSLREEETAEREFMKPWLENQREIYLQALSAAATVANSDDPEKLKQATEEFWELYQGQMILVETKSVSGAMVYFGYCLDGTETCSKTELNSRSRALGTAMAESMAATAKMTYKEFAANQFRYTSEP